MYVHVLVDIYTVSTIIPQLGTCPIENVWRATVEYGAVLVHIALFLRVYM